MKKFVCILVLFMLTVVFINAQGNYNFLDKQSISVNAITDTDLFNGVSGTELTLKEMEKEEGGIIQELLAFAAIYGTVDIVYSAVTGHELSIQAHKLIVKPLYNKAKKFLRRHRRRRPYYYDSRKVHYRFS